MKKVLFTEEFLSSNYADNEYSQLPVQPYELEDFGEAVEDGLIVPVYEYDELHGKMKKAAHQNVLAYATDMGMGRDVRTEQEFSREVEGALFFENGTLLDQTMTKFAKQAYGRHDI